MSFFDNLLTKRNLDSCPLPLWRLKVTDEEYEELRQQLGKQTRLLGQLPFQGMFRECTLFFAEFWRRGYVDGAHSKQMVFDALTNALPSRNGIDFCYTFYEAAKKGAKELKIEVYEASRSRTLDSMLYQGGLPMKLVITPDTITTWDRFTKGLVFRNNDFDELNLGIVATSSQSMRGYCTQLCDAVDTKQYMLMPFYCENEFNPWFQFLLNKFNVVRRTQRQSHPFVLDWDFTIDNIEQKIFVKYDLKGLQRLPGVFLEQKGLDKLAFFTVSIRKNEKAVDSFDFNQGFSRYEVRSKHPYFNGDVISLYIHEQETPHISEDLDMSTPHLLYSTGNGLYKLGNQIGRQDSVLLVSVGWTIEEEESYKVKTYKWNDVELKGVIIPANFDGEIVAEGIDGKMTFGNNSILYWTEMAYPQKINMSNVIEPIYNVEEATFSICYDGADTVIKKNDKSIEFRSKWQNEWHNTPSYGEIFARAIDLNGNFVTPIRFINVGKDLIISIVEADKDTCKIRVVWPYGNVFTPVGKKQIDNVWLIKKEDCEDIRKIPFEFTPAQDNQNRFMLTVKAPFKDFSIDDIDGKALQTDSWVPYSDLDKYQYHLVGMDIRHYQFGDHVRRLIWIGDNLYIFESKKVKQSIPYEGNLLQLLDSRELLRAILERTSQNMLWASIPVEFSLEGGKTLKFEIKDSPYRLLQKGNKVIVTGNHQIPFDYRRALKLFKLDEPDYIPITLTYNKEEGFVLPEAIRKWGKTIAIGRSRGRICPALVDLAHEMDGEYRQSSREDAITAISHQIEEATMGDATWKRIIGWFKCTQKEDVPASSLLDLHCVAQRSDSLLKLAFQLYCQTGDEEERDTLLDQLKYMSNDLAFQWFWLLPAVRSGLLNIINTFIKDLKHPTIIQMYVQWAVKQVQDMNKYLSAMADDSYYTYAMDWIVQLIQEDFKDWMLKLCTSSMQDAYKVTADVMEDNCLIKDIVDNYCHYLESDNSRYIETNQDSLDEETKSFFIPYQEKNKPANEQWMLERVNVLADHLNGKIDILSQTDKVRRSLIFCYKSTKSMFLVALNNRLIH